MREPHDRAKGDIQDTRSTPIHLFFGEYPLLEMLDNVSPQVLLCPMETIGVIACSGILGNLVYERIGVLEGYPLAPPQLSPETGDKSLSTDTDDLDTSIAGRPNERVPIIGLFFEDSRRIPPGTPEGVPVAAHTEACTAARVIGSSIAIKASSGPPSPTLPTQELPMAPCAGTCPSTQKIRVP